MWQIKLNGHQLYMAWSFAQALGIYEKVRITAEAVNGWCELINYVTEETVMEDEFIFDILGDLLEDDLQ